jgi:hypothetical protein
MPVFEKWIGPLRAEASARLAELGISARILVFVAFAVGLAALPSIATSRFSLGLGFILLSRFLAVISLTNAKAPETDLAAAFDLIFLASVPFAFALNNPSVGLAGSLQLFAMIAAGAASLFANSGRGLASLDIAICVAGFVLACLRPDWFALIAYVLSLFCFVAAGARIALAFTRSGA